MNKELESTYPPETEKFEYRTWDESLREKKRINYREAGGKSISDDDEYCTISKRKAFQRVAKENSNQKRPLEEELDGDEGYYTIESAQKKLSESQEEQQAVAPLLIKLRTQQVKSNQISEPIQKEKKSKDKPKRDKRQKVSERGEEKKEEEREMGEEKQKERESEEDYNDVSEDDDDEDYDYKKPLGKKGKRAKKGEHEKKVGNTKKGKKEKKGEEGEDEANEEIKKGRGRGRRGKGKVISMNASNARE